MPEKTFPRAMTRAVPVPRQPYEIDDQLLRFKCEECGKLLGADPAMVIVQCSKCKMVNRVPNREVAFAQMSQPVRLVSVDIPFRMCLLMGCRFAVAAIPMIVLLAMAACGVVTVAWLLWTE